MAPLRFGPQVCGELAVSAEREWLVTDGCGGYAMGTVAGLRTRRYHGLLMVSDTTPGASPARRRLALAALDPVLTLASGAQLRLATHEWSPGEIDPAGHHLLESFELLDGLPVWRWRVGDVVLERTIAMGRRRPAVTVMHRLLAGGPVTLSLDPLCTWRDGHGERQESHGLQVDPAADGVVVEGAYRLSGPSFEPGSAWYRGCHYREEAARGLNADEDLFRVGRFSGRLQVGDDLSVQAWAGALDDRPPPPAVMVDDARRHARAVLARAGGRPAGRPAGRADDLGTLALAADAFVIRPGGSGPPDVVAGYPWFGPWSRDTMISYDGLFLAADRADEGRDLLRAYAGTLSEGMLANTADTGQVEHNTADATLWFLHAVDRHLSVTGDTDLAAELIGALDEVIARHVAGTRFGIVVDPADGLLTQGAPGYALTWMDAVVNGVPVTPRHGKAVELNALWINGLAVVAGVRERLGRDASELTRRRDRAAAGFATRFPSPSGWLYDVVDGPAGDDDSLRPHQVLAYGLPHAPLRPHRAGPATSPIDPGPVAAVGQALLTPLGLRTLAPTDPAYRGRHQGDPASRDSAYHQGTVWPWLLGPYLDAARAVGLPVDGVLAGIRAHLDEWGLGSVSETAHGDAPHGGTGCPFQAWSVAETFRQLRHPG